MGWEFGALCGCAAGAPPRSDDYPDDDSWERAQNEWLQRWQPGAALPARGNKKRRTEWDKLTKKHARRARKVDTEPDEAAPAGSPPAILGKSGAAGGCRRAPVTYMGIGRHREAAAYLMSGTGLPA